MHHVRFLHLCFEGKTSTCFCVRNAPGMTGAQLRNIGGIYLVEFSILAKCSPLKYILGYAAMRSAMIQSLFRVENIATIGLAAKNAGDFKECQFGHYHRRRKAGRGAEFIHIQ